MKSAEEIEHEIRELPPSDVARLAAWFADFDAKIWDKQMEDDAVSGKLDFLFDEAENERKARKVRDRPSKRTQS